MDWKPGLTSVVVLAVAGLGGCGGEKSSKELKQTTVALHHIKGKMLTMPAANASDAGLSAGGDSLFLIDGVRRYRLFVKAPVDVTADAMYEAEGVWAQKAIDEIGDPNGGKKGYPLAASCQRVIRMAWSGLPIDATDGHASMLRTVVNRYPARPVFLVTKLTAVEGGKSEEEKELPEISVPAEKQKAMLVSGPGVQPAPLWAAEGGTAVCKVIIDEKGNVAELETGKQLCEAAPWEEFHYKPPVQGGKPVRVKTEVEVKFEAKK